MIIEDPDYVADSTALKRISDEIAEYSSEHRLLKAPNPIAVFFRQGDDHRIREINEELEGVIDDLSNARDKILLGELNNYPVLATHAHTRPFRRRSLNIATGILLPLGVFMYFRMWRFRLRLYKDLRVIRRTNDNIANRIAVMMEQK